MKNSPGPWKVEVLDDKTYIYDSDGNILANVIVVNKADLRLMVAAPTMLKLLSDLNDMSKESIETSGDIRPKLPMGFFGCVNEALKFVRGDS